MTRDTDERGKLLKTLQDSVDDPMWADHVEMPKRILRIVIERLRAPAGHAEREALIERLRSSASDLCHPDGCCYANTMLEAAAALSNAPAPSEGVREKIETGPVTVNEYEDSAADTEDQGPDTLGERP